MVKKLRGIVPGSFLRYRSRAVINNPLCSSSATLIQPTNQVTQAGPQKIWTQLFKKHVPNKTACSTSPFTSNYAESFCPIRKPSRVFLAHRPHVPAHPPFPGSSCCVVIFTEAGIRAGLPDQVVPFPSFSVVSIEQDCLNT